MKTFDVMTYVTLDCDTKLEPYTQISEILQYNKKALYLTEDF